MYSFYQSHVIHAGNEKFPAQFLLTPVEIIHVHPIQMD